MKIAIITAGGAGMFCGSCMQDNTMTRALRRAGMDAVLVPTYTPITVDEENVSTHRVFLGGLNVYLDSAMPGWKNLPGWMTHWLNRPTLIRWLSKLGTTDAARLGSLTLDMLRGTHGPQQREIQEFADYLCDDLKPDMIVFSNALLSGTVNAIRDRFPGTILCLLQGDDVFLDALTPRWKEPVLQQIRENCQQFDGFLTHSEFYRRHMADYLAVPEDRFRQIPLTVDVNQTLADVLSSSPASPPPERFCVGYFARICAEKGIHNLLEAARIVLPKVPNVEFKIAGYLPSQDRRWFEREVKQLQTLAPGRVHWLGSPSVRAEKFRIIRSFDVMCVPTTYEEPKGLYVLEAGLASVRSLLPDHGAFPELVTSLQCGTLYDSTASEALANAIMGEVSQTNSPDHDLPDRIRNRHSMETTGPIIAAVMAEMQR